MAVIAAGLAGANGDIAALAVMDVAAGLALHGFHIATDFIAVFGVVWAKAPAVRLQRKSRKRQQTQYKNAGQENCQYSFHTVIPSIPGAARFLTT